MLLLRLIAAKDSEDYQNAAGKGDFLLPERVFFFWVQKKKIFPTPRPVVAFALRFIYLNHNFF